VSQKKKECNLLPLMVHKVEYKAEQQIEVLGNPQRQGKRSKKSRYFFLFFMQGKGLSLDPSRIFNNAHYLLVSLQLPKIPEGSEDGPFSCTLGPAANQL
jgi:hypothetical protein